jgi:hypothetical protein
MIEQTLIGTDLELSYPTTTHVRYADKPFFRDRIFRVVKIRDLVQEPLTVAEFLRRPYNRRSRYLILGQEGNRYRQFYLGCAAGYEAPGQLRLALYDPEGYRPLELLARPFECDVRDRKIMLRLLSNWVDKDFGGLVLRVFADDLGLAG